MNQVSPPQLDTNIYEANLSALRQVVPALAEHITRALAAMRAATPAFTRDGHLSFRMEDAQGKACWFGRTSVPTVRASALVDRFEAGHGNVLLPGLGQGSEVALLLRRLGQHRAVFVWEPQVTTIALSLHLHDWAQAITAERLVWLACEPGHLTETLTAWLADHPGHLCPDRIIVWPWSTPPELAACRASLQAAYQETETRRAEAMRRLKSQLDCIVAVPQTHATTPTVAFLSRRAHEEIWALSEAMSDAAGAQGWKTLVAGVRWPCDVHPLARARRLIERHEHQLDAAVLLDVTRQDIRDILPEATPAISWLGSHSVLDSSLVQRIGPRDRVAVTHHRLREQVIEAGLDSDRVVVVPYPCLAPADALDERDLTTERPFDLAIIADLVPTVPEHFGHRLPSHLQLWQAAREMIESRIDTFTSDQGDSFLSQVENKLKTRIEDHAIRSLFVETLSKSVANTLLWRKIAQLLSNNKFKLIIGGRGWSVAPIGLQAVSAATAAQQWQILRQTKIFFHANVTGEVSRTALLAAAAGSVLMARAHPRDSQPGGLSTLLTPGSEMVTFTHMTDLMSTLKNVLKNADFLRKMANQAADRCRVAHRPEHRLATLIPRDL